MTMCPVCFVCIDSICRFGVLGIWALCVSQPTLLTAAVFRIPSFLMEPPPPSGVAAQPPAEATDYCVLSAQSRYCIG